MEQQAVLRFLAGMVAGTVVAGLVWLVAWFVVLALRGPDSPAAFVCGWTIPFVFAIGGIVGMTAAIVAPRR